MPATKKQFNSSDVKVILTGAFVSVLAVLLLCAVGSALMTHGVIGEGSLRECCACALVLGTAAGGFYVTQNRGERYLLTAIICGLIFIAVRLTCSFMFGNSNGGVTNIESVVCILCGSVLGGLPRKQKRKRKR